MSVEKKFKLSLLGLEKKILDLEEMVSDLSEKVKKIDLKDFQKKLEEFEDLVMVSNLALMDLKGKVEAIEKGKLTSEEFEKLVNEIKPDVIAKLDKDIKKVESELDSLKEEMQPKKISEIKERIGLIENKISQITSSVERMEKRSEKIGKIYHEMEVLKQKLSSLDEKIKVFEGLEEKIKNLRSKLSSTKKKLEEIRSSLQPEEINKRIDSFEERLEEELGKVDARIGGIERGVEELREEIRKKPSEKEIRKIAELEDKVAGTQKLLENLQKDFEELKLSLPLNELKERIGILEVNLKDLASEQEKAKNLVSNLSVELEKISKEVSGLEEREIKKILAEISSLRNDFSKEMRMVKEEVENLTQKTSGVDVALLASKFNSLKESVDYLLNRKVEMDMKVRALEETLSKMLSGSETIPQNIMKSLERFSQRLKLIESEIGNLKSLVDDLSEKTSSLDGRMKMIEVSAGMPPTLPEEAFKTLSKLKELENRIRILETTPKPTKEIDLLALTSQIEEIEKNVKLEIVSLTNTFKSQISKIENKIKELESKLRLQSIIRPEDERIASLLAKINQLEGKITMIERKIGSKAPIVLE